MTWIVEKILVDKNGTCPKPCTIESYHVEVLPLAAGKGAKTLKCSHERDEGHVEIVKIRTSTKFGS